MNELIPRNRAGAELLDAAAIERARDRRYQDELAAEATELAARITNLDDRDRATLDAMLKAIQQIHVTVVDAGGGTAPAPAFTPSWEAHFLAPADGATFQLPNDTTATWLVTIRMSVKLICPQGPSEAAHAVLLAARVILHLGDGTPGVGPLTLSDAIPEYTDGGYLVELAPLQHAYHEGDYTLSLVVDSPIAPQASADTNISVLPYEPPPPPPPPRYKCVVGACVQDENGPYSSLAACEAACTPPVVTYTYWIWNGIACQSQSGTSVPAGSYPTQAECQAAHQLQTWWRFDGAECIREIGFERPAGTYDTEDLCWVAHPPGGPPPPPPPPPERLPLSFTWGTHTPDVGATVASHVYLEMAGYAISKDCGLESSALIFDTAWMVIEDRPAGGAPVPLYEGTLRSRVFIYGYERFCVGKTWPLHIRGGWLDLSPGAHYVWITIYRDGTKSEVAGAVNWYFIVR